MEPSLKSPEHPAEKSPDSNIRGPGGTFPSRLAALLPSFMRSLYHEACCMQQEVKTWAPKLRAHPAATNRNIRIKLAMQKLEGDDQLKLPLA